MRCYSILAVEMVGYLSKRLNSLMQTLWGVELDAGRYRECLRKIKENHLEDRVTVIHGNLLEVNLKQADVVTLYLLTSANDKLRPNLERELKNGARVVSHDFPISTWKAKKVEKIQENWGSHTLYLYSL